MRETEGTRPGNLTSARARHRGAPSPETAEILERYRSAMRRELRHVLDGIEASGAELPAERAKRWDLAIKLGRELGSRETREPEAPAAISRPSAPPRLTAAQRRELG
jgi:hypothetical protein